MVVPEHLKKLSKSRVDTPHRTECTGYHLVVVVNLEILEKYRMWGDAGYGYGNASLNYCNPPRKGGLLASESKSISPFPLNRDFGGIRHGVDWVLGSMFPLLGGSHTSQHRQHDTTVQQRFSVSRVAPGAHQKDWLVGLTSAVQTLFGHRILSILQPYPTTKLFLGFIVHPNHRHGLHDWANSPARQLCGEIPKFRDWNPHVMCKYRKSPQGSLRVGFQAEFGQINCLQLNQRISLMWKPNFMAAIPNVSLYWFYQFGGITLPTKFTASASNVFQSNFRQNPWDSHFIWKNPHMSGTNQQSLCKWACKYAHVCVYNLSKIFTCKYVWVCVCIYVLHLLYIQCIYICI